MESVAVFETVQQRDYHEEYLKEILGPMIRNHRKGLIVLHNGTILHLFTVRQCENREHFVGLKLDKVFEFISDQVKLDEVRKTLLPCLRKW